MEKLSALMADVLQVSADTITDDLTINDLDTWDSLAHMELVAVIEQQYDLSLEAEDMVAMISVAKIREIVSARDNG